MKLQQMLTCLLLLASSILIGSQAAPAALAGSLDPAGPPAPTMKPLDDVEPRTAISSLPITITTAGSYYLTRNLTYGGTTAITVNAGPTTIDLNGYALDGLGSGGKGISATYQTVRVRNGTIRDFATGLNFIEGTQGLESLIVEACQSGAVVGNATILGSTFIGRSTASGVGINSPTNVVIVKDTRVANFATGMRFDGPRNLVDSCIIDFNDVGAIISGEGSTIRNSNVAENSSDGIRVNLLGLGTRVSDNNVYKNGGDGIEMLSEGCRVEGNSVVVNVNWGIRAPTGNNLFIRNNAVVNGSGNFSFTNNSSVQPVEVDTITDASSNVSQ